MEDVSAFQARFASSEMTHVHQLQRQNTHLLQTHKVYLSAMSQLEAQLTDCRAQLRLRDKELDLLRTANLAGQWHTDLSLIKTLEGRAMQLEEENRHLRQNAALSADIEKMKTDLAQAVDLRNSYRGPIVEQEETNTADEVQEDPNVLAALRRANQTLHDELQATLKELEKTRLERDFLRGEVVPVLEQAIKLYELEKNELEKKLEETKSRVQSPTSDMSAPTHPDITVKTMTDAVRSPKNMLRAKSSLSPKNTALQSKPRPAPLRRTFIYSPSFLRNKNPPDKRQSHVPKSQPHAREDNFADVFPEENELV